MNSVLSRDSQHLPERAWKVMACCHCGSRLGRVDSGATCLGCGTEFPRTATGSIDLRLRQPKPYSLPLTLGAPLVPAGFSFGPLEENATPEVDLRNLTVPWHLTRELMSYVPCARNENSLMLDLGCGSGLHRGLGEHAGFQWIGLDYDNSKAPILGDAHSLPFDDQSFELVLSLAVLEHIQFPMVMAREVARVLKPGGLFVGTVAFLEPFHGNSYYHHTHLATFNTLQCGGLEVLKVAPNRDWNVLEAHVRMGSGLFPKMPRLLGSVLVGPLQIMHRLWWWAGGLVTPKSNQEARLLGTTGAFEFVARRP